MSDDYEEIIAVIASGQILDYMYIVATGLLAYDYIITFDREIELFWKRKRSLSSVLFLFNRYLSLVASILSLVKATTAMECATYFYTQSILNRLQDLPGSLFSTLRTYALSTGSGQWPLAILVFLLSNVTMVVNSVDLGFYQVEFDPTLGCYVNDKLSIAIQNRFAISSRVCTVAGDILVMIITWRATYRTSREAAEVLHQKSTLSKVLLRDGAMYFIVLSIMNTLHLSLTLNAIFAVNNLGSNGSFIELLIEPLSTIIISRFLIDLQAANNEMMHQHSQVSSIGSLHFMGSLASSLPAPGERSPVCSIQDNDENARDVGYDMAGTGIIMDGSTPLAHSSVEEGTSREFGTMGVSS